jgi:hypothetical protein
MPSISRKTLWSLFLSSILTLHSTTLHAWNSEFVKTEKKDGTNVSTYNLTTNDGTAIFAQRIDFYLKTNLLVSELREGGLKFEVQRASD